MVLFGLHSRHHVISIAKRFLARKVPKGTVLSNFTTEDISLCVLGNGAEGNPRSLLIDYNDRLFMFNCGEGLQRIVPNSGYKYSKVLHFFMTSNKWQNMSGLAGLMLAHVDAGINEFNMTGIDSEKVVRDLTKFDTKLRRLKINHINCESEQSFVCDNLDIKPIVVDYEDKKSIVYLGTIAPRLGQINLEKCFNLRVPRHMVPKLVAGEAVVLENGKTILPSEASNPDQPEKKFCIFEPLSIDFLTALERNSTIRDFLQSSECIVHFTEKHILEQPEYKYFMKNLNKSYHLLINELNPSLSLHTAHRFQNQLHLIDSKIFPRLSEKLDSPEDHNQDDKNIFENDKVINCFTFLNFHLRPHTEDRESLITFEKIPTCDLKEARQSLLHIDGTIRIGINEALETLKQQQDALQSNNQKYPEIVFLGTCSSLPHTIRNVSAILVNLSPHESMLLDCGEGTYGQLLRFYGESKIKQILKNLRVIYITHHHSDHHMGLIQLIEKHDQYTGRKLFLILPPLVSAMLVSKTSGIMNLDDLANKYSFWNNRYFDDRSRERVLELLPSLKLLHLIPVSHCANAYAISMTAKSGFKLVYSGDTEPCETLVKGGRNCDLLIHEATVEEGLENFARNTFHSTVTEAIDVGKKMNARFTILTHFSPRYGKMISMAGNEHHKNVGLAFDNMRVSPCELERLPLMYNALRCMYAKHLDNIEYRSELYSRKFGEEN